jgi:hexosaminidase
MALAPLVLTMAILVASQATAATKSGAKAFPALIPLPAKVDFGDGEFVLSANTTIQTDEAMSGVGQYLAKALEPATGFPLRQEQGKATTRAITIVASNSAAMGNEGYHLEVRPDRVVIAASKPAGAFYACQTLRQLLPPEIMGRHVPAIGVRWAIPCVSVDDKPRFPWRGVLLDSARSFHSKQFVIDFIDRIAGFKINVLQWHLTDDEGWRLDIPKYPKLVRPIAKPAELPWMNDGYYTQADIREIVAYAASRHVMIVPEIEMPGHCHAMLINYPELAPVKMVERTGAAMPCRVVDLGNPKTLEVFQDVLQDVFRLFPSRYVHLGGDEAETEVWLNSPKAKAKMKELNLTDPAQLQKWWMKQMAKFVHDKGRISMAWGERLDLGMPLEGQIIQGWRAESAPAVKAGYQTVNSENEYTYFDYGNVPGDGQLGVLPLSKVYAFTPLPLANLDAEKDRLVLGSIAPVWVASEKTMDKRLFPRLLAFAEVVWTEPSQRSYEAFLGRARAHLPRLTAAGIAYFPSPELNASKR